jgi:hypothetical protein
MKVFNYNILAEYLDPKELNKRRIETTHENSKFVLFTLIFLS